jgi:hypothetical protein
MILVPLCILWLLIMAINIMDMHRYLSVFEYAYGYLPSLVRVHVYVGMRTPVPRYRGTYLLVPGKEILLRADTVTLGISIGPYPG